MDLEPPPERETYNSLDALMRHVNAHAGSHGYAVVKKRSKRRRKDNEVCKVFLCCDRSRKDKPALSTESRKRNTSSRRIECPFDVVAKMDMMGTWTLHVRDGTHNHEPTNPCAHPALRKPTEEEKEVIKSTTQAGADARITINTLRLNNPTTNLLARDVYNARAQLRRENLGDLTPVRTQPTGP